MKGIKATKRRGFICEKALRGGFLVFVLYLSSTIPASAYVPVVENDGFRWKFYSSTINNENCYRLLAEIPDEYKDNINYIKVLPKSNNKYGQYWWQTRSIDLFGSCRQDVLIHELAHHCQYQRGDYFWQAHKHQGQFNECEDEIWQSIRD